MAPSVESKTTFLFGKRTIATILLAWELGGGLGHIRPLLRIAHALVERGHQPVFAVRNLIEAWPVYRGKCFPFLQSPIRQRQRRTGRPPFQAATFADILAMNGFDHPDHLAPLVQGWQTLLDVVRPDLVVADHSPTLCLTAYGSIPTVLLGTGFVLPPAHLPEFPVLVPGATAQLPQNQILRVMQQVQHDRGRPAPPTLPRLLVGSNRFLTIWPEVDPYENIRAETHAGPLEELPPPAPRAPTRNFFAYLTADHPRLEEIVTGLAQSGITGQAYVRSANPDQRQRWRSRGLPVLDVPPSLEEVLPQTTVIVHHGGAGTSHAALAAGRPQLLLPQHLEHACTAQRLHMLGVAHYLGQPAVDEVAQALRSMVSSEPLAVRAMEVAQTCRARAAWKPLEAIVAACIRLLESRGEES